jgi:putative metallohydrolase (TIGR04338 family)
MKLGVDQARMYAAESSLQDVGMRWTRYANAQAYVDGLIESEWFFERWPHLLRCTVERRGSGARWSTCARVEGDRCEGVILVAPGALTQPVVLHELAHLVLPPDCGHGAPFPDTMLELVRHEMGFYAYSDLLTRLSG